MSPTRIAALRRRLGENTRVFGARFARSGRTVEDWESGRRRPDKLVRSLMKDLAAVCGIVGYPEAGRRVCELPAGHDEPYHRQGRVRWLGYHVDKRDSRR